MTELTEVLLLKMAHLLCLVYWLGGDLGVFYSSFSVVDEKKTPEARVVAAKILFALDQGPRLCMPLILATGVHLAWKFGIISADGAWIVATWLICLAWVAMVLILHFVHNRDLRLLVNFDLGFRVVVIISLLTLGVGAVSGLHQWVPAWAGWKLGIFALLVLFGLIIRVRLKPFGPAFARLASNDIDDQVNRDIRHSLASCRPFVLAIWLGLLINTAFGLHLLP